jgi:hypothetical protein
MKYDGVVAKFDELYLFILNPNTYKLMDGINLSDHACYNDMKKNQLMVVEVVFKDGTVEIENLDLDEFIYGDKYDKHNTFMMVADINLFSIGDSEKPKKSLSLEKIARNGKLNDIAINCIKLTKESEKEIQENILMLKKDLNDILNE